MTVSVTPGRLLFTSGMTGRSSQGPVVPGGMAPQARRVFERLQAMLEHAGAGFHHTIKQNVFTTDPDAYNADGRTIGSAAFGEHRPASTDLVVPCLADPAMCIEVELVADLSAPVQGRPLLEKYSVEPHGIDYAQGVIVNGGRLIYTAGQVANIPNGSVAGIGDMQRQAEKTYENIDHVLRAGGTTPANVVKETIWVLDMEAWHQQGAPVRQAFYNGDFPAATLLGIQGLTEPEKWVEIEVIAAVA